MDIKLTKQEQEFIKLSKKYDTAFEQRIEKIAKTFDTFVKSEVIYCHWDYGDKYRYNYEKLAELVQAPNSESRIVELTEMMLYVKQFINCNGVLAHIFSKYSQDVFNYLYDDIDEELFKENLAQELNVDTLNPELTKLDKLFRITTDVMSEVYNHNCAWRSSAYDC